MLPTRRRRRPLLHVMFRLPTANPRCRALLQVAAAIAAKEALQAAKDVRTLIAVDDYNALYWQTGEAAARTCVRGGWAVFMPAGQWDVTRGSWLYGRVWNHA